MLPRWASLENPKDGQFLEIATYPGYGPSDIVDCNWLQSFENVMDQIHVVWLHGMHSGQQFVFESDVLPQMEPITNVHGAVAALQWELTAQGVANTMKFPLPGGAGYGAFTVELTFPNCFCVPGFDDMGWIVPVDDTHHVLIQIGMVSQRGEMAKRAISHNGKTWRECSPAELQ